jgi:hypothetical protein
MRQIQWQALLGLYSQHHLSLTAWSAVLSSPSRPALRVPYFLCHPWDHGTPRVSVCLSVLWMNSMATIHLTPCLHSKMKSTAEISPMPATTDNLPSPKNPNHHHLCHISTHPSGMLFQPRTMTFSQCMYSLQHCVGHHPTTAYFPCPLPAWTSTRQVTATREWATGILA